jgi:hypothetical protein
MTGGLLEKAKQKVDDDEEGAFSATGDPENPDFKKESKILDAEPSGGGGGLLSKAASGEEKDPSDKPILLYTAAGSLIVSLILIYLLSELPEFAGYGVFALLLASFVVASIHVKNDRNEGGNLTGIQWGTLAVIYLLLGAVPYVGAMDFGGRTAITEVAYDEASETVTLSMRYTSGLFGSSLGTGDVDITVLYDETEVWSTMVSVAMSESSEGGGEIGTFSLDVDEFYAGNAYQVTGGAEGVPELSEKRYEVIASIDGSAASGAYLPSQNLTRTITDLDVNIHPYVDGECDNGYDSCVKRLYFTGWAGHSSPSHDANSIPASIRGDYNLSIDFTYVDWPEKEPEDDTEQTIDYPTITISGTHATWDATSGDYGTGISTIGERTTEFPIEGEEQDSVGRWYFDRDTALVDYGCYRLDFSSTQTGPDANGGTGYTMPPTFYMYEEQYHDGTDDDDTTPDGDPSDWETFEEVPSC